jgi:hypothetical protein
MSSKIGFYFRTTDETLKEYVTKFGEVSDSLVMKDQTTGQSRCFGFVTFTDPLTIDEFMKQRPHTLDGRQIDPKRASMKLQIIIVHHFFSLLIKCHVKKQIMMMFI